MTRRLLAVLAGVPLLLLAAAWTLDRCLPPDLHRLAELGTVVQARDGRTLAVLPAPGGVWRFAADADSVAPALIDLLVATEDARFRWHPGVDPLALARAAVQWVRAGHVVSGGSTLAMQAARLLHPRPRTLAAKLSEMARALQLEWRYGRAGVLRIWLTLAPSGGNLEGVRAASLAWFGHEPLALEPAEAALLVAIPRRPEAYRPDRHPQAAGLVRARVLRVGTSAGLFASAEPPPIIAARLPMPRHAAQLVPGLPHHPVVATTLDLALQTALERLAEARLKQLPPRTSLAVLIGDAGTRQIRAVYAGAWGDRTRAGALDLTRAVRSPGSALKPFIYAMAFADGIAGPQTVLADVPHLFGAYAPENFDRGFAGGVTAAEALRQSLNLPAVLLLDRVGPRRFAEALRTAGTPLHLPPGAAPSLPLALGGGGITLRDAAALYAALATDGRVQPLSLLADAPETPRPLLQASAAAAVAAVLTRPFPGSTQPGMAWKTGTSWGGRDAWAFGFDARSVVAVWVGRPDGTPVPGATGTALALPLLAQVFGLLDLAPRAVVPADGASSGNSLPDGPSVGDTLAARPLAGGTRGAGTVFLRGPALGADALRLLFPPPDAVVSVDAAITIRAMGGRRPLTFMVDGTPIAAQPAFRQTEWLPPGPGFYRLTIVDADGAAVHAAVRVAAPAPARDAVSPAPAAGAAR